MHLPCRQLGASCVLRIGGANLFLANITEVVGAAAGSTTDTPPLGSTGALAVRRLNITADDTVVALKLEVIRGNLASVTCMIIAVTATVN